MAAPRHSELPVVLLPGMMCDHRLFAPQIPPLEGRGPVMVADLSRQDTIADMARAVLDGAPERFALAGLSMGGIVAMEVLHQAPGRVARLALLDTNPLAETDAVRATRPGQIARAAGGGLDEMMQDTFIPRYLADPADPMGIAGTCRAMAADLGPEVFRLQSAALAGRADRCETLRAARLPVLILCGAEDRLCPVARHDLMAELMPHAAYRVLPGIGHLPTLEAPEATTGALLSWLEES